VAVVAATAAHEAAAVGGRRGLVAAPARGAQRAQGVIGDAVVRRLVHVHQVLGRGHVEAPLAHLKFAPAVHLHLGGRVVLVFEVVAHLPERRQLLPAGDQRAGPGHTVALARHAHLADHRLRRTEARTHPSAGLVVVQVHELPALSERSPRVILLPLSDVDEALREAVAVRHVVPAASPDPVPAQVVRPQLARAAAAAQLPVAARPGHRVHHARSRHGVRERSLPARCV
ncbi:unnamed protein product, partial [Ixodes persulcatus]